MDQRQQEFQIWLGQQLRAMGSWRLYLWFFIAAAIGIIPLEIMRWLRGPIPNPGAGEIAFRLMVGFCTFGAGMGLFLWRIATYRT